MTLSTTATAAVKAKASSLDRVELGARMAARKDELLAQVA